MDDMTYSAGVSPATANPHGQVLLCHGSYDSHIKTGEDYKSISWADILDKVRSPGTSPKAQAPAIIPSSYVGHDGRSHAVQRECGTYWFLTLDIDSGNADCADVVRGISSITGVGVTFCVYSTASSTPENRKWRGLIPLLRPVDGRDFAETANALFDLLAEEGLCPDRALARTGQLVYLPNVPADRRNADGSPVFYEHQIVTGRLLDLAETPIPEQMEARRIAGEEKLEQLKAVAAEKERMRAANRASHLEIGQDHQVIDAFNSDNPLEAMLEQCGYECDGRGNWRSPLQKGGTFATKVFGQRWYSLSTSDEEGGLGQRAASGGCFGDAFDLFVHFAHGGNVGAAFRAAAEARRSAGFEALGAEAYIDEAARREQQQAENRRIGEGAEEQPAPLPELLSLDMALARFVFATQGSQVIDLASPRRLFTFGDFRNSIAASRETIRTTNKKTGETTERDVPTSALWMASAKRKTVNGRTFRPGAGTFTTDPHGLPAVNTYKAPHRPDPSARYEQHVGTFEGHIRYLFEDDADAFLDWLAHIEQYPGVLPHRAWLHIATATGCGRNWAASVLTRIWRGYVAASFNLVGSLGSGFNGELSQKLLAIVDEVREGARDAQWEHSETLKKLITEEQRNINVKYGTAHVEFNCCRWLLFSNSTAALPLERSDRRFEVHVFDGRPRPESYYAELYGLVDNPAFTNDIAVWLGRRSLAAFNPGSRARASASKARVLEASETEAMAYARAVVEHWPSDLIASNVLSSIINPRANGGVDALVRLCASEADIRPRGALWAGGRSRRMYTVRNHDRWADGRGSAEEFSKAPEHPGIEEDGWRGYLDSLVASKTTA